jgi:hypothetical protein
MTTKGYKISNKGNTMIITHSDTGEHIAEYRMTPGHEVSEIRQMRRAIDKHLAEPNGTLGNYQW